MNPRTSSISENITSKSTCRLRAKYRTLRQVAITGRDRPLNGLASFEVKNDPTLRPGDIGSTKEGLMANTGKSGDTHGNCKRSPAIEEKTNVVLAARASLLL